MRSRWPAKLIGPVGGHRQRLLNGPASRAVVSRAPDPSGEAAARGPGPALFCLTGAPRLRLAGAQGSYLRSSMRSVDEQVLMYQRGNAGKDTNLTLGLVINETAYLQQLVTVEVLRRSLLGTRTVLGPICQPTCRPFLIRFLALPCALQRGTSDGQLRSVRTGQMAPAFRGRHASCVVATRHFLTAALLPDSTGFRSPTW